MKTKDQKRNEARKNAEAIKAAKKATRLSKGNLMATAGKAKKGKSLVPQTKAKKK